MAEQQSSLMRRTIRRALAASGITAAILYGWWQTIEAARTAPVVPETQLGSPLALGRVTLTPLSLQLRSDLLVLSARVENVTSETQPAPLGYPPRLVTVEADNVAFSAPEVTLLRDRQALYQLQPRMPEDVEITWQVPEGWQAGKLSLTFFQQQFKLKDNLYGRSNWLGYSAAAHMAAIPEPTP
ncbi:hypothetical protein [Pollutimonas bauzanensis]|uniref:hypothetical protein n=1 Tax=Pollutimonas bauzanensis TaxID=658167 RepID=UPI0033401FBD